MSLFIRQKSDITITVNADQGKANKIKDSLVTLIKNIDAANLERLAKLSDNIIMRGGLIEELRKLAP